jgi:choline transport protein
VYFSLTTYFVTIITILACAAPNFRSGTWVFSDTTNSTGWDNNGLAFIFCTMNALYGYLGLDAGAHLCEEIPNPTVNVPKVIVSLPKVTHTPVNPDMPEDVPGLARLCY